MKKLPEVIYIRSHAVSVKQALLMFAAFLGGLVLGMLISPKKGKKEESVIEIEEKEGENDLDVPVFLDNQIPEKASGNFGHPTGAKNKVPLEKKIVYRFK